MSDIFATLAAGTARPAAATGSETAVRVVDPSPELTRLATGESLRGTVVGKDDRGHLMIQTRLGVLQVAALRALPVGSEVVLLVRSVGPQVMMTLLPLDAAAAAPAAAPAQASGAAPALPANPHDLVQSTLVLRGILHAAPPVPLLAGLPTAQPGAELLVRILALGVQSQVPSSAALPGQPAAAAPGTVAGATSQGMPGGGTAIPSGGQPAGQVPGQVPNQIPGQIPGQVPAQSSGPAGNLLGSSPGNPAGTQAGAPVAGAAAGAGNAAAGAQTPGIQTPGVLTPGVLTPGGQTSGGQTTGLPAAATPATAPTGTVTETAAGLRLAPQTPVANSGHSVASALQNVSSEAAARAAGSPSGPQSSATAAAPGSGSEAGLRVTGLVTAATSSGQPILHTPLGTVTLDTRAALPLGSSLALQITLPGSTPQTPAAQALAAAWPSLETLEETLLHSLPAAQMEAAARALPQVGPRLASGMLFFLSALNQGNLAAWLSPSMAAAERLEHGDLFERLGREFAGLNRNIETPAGEWRFVNLPLWSDQGLRELRCFFRHQDQGGGKGDGGEKATRFVLELDLERHGALQLDGLVRARRFDLLLRSRRPLPALVRGDLMALFEEANAIAGYSGQLVFQASSDWLQLLAAQSAAQPHEGLNV